MAFIRKRGNKYSVVYKIKDENNVDRQKSETFATKKEADRRKKEIEYKMALGNFKAPKCILLKELLEKYYKELLEMPSVRSSRNQKGEEKISASTVNEIHKLLRSCFRQAVKWDMMEKNPAIDVTYKLKLSGGDIKAVQGDSGHAQADMDMDISWMRIEERMHS